jgi:hypothetical protein
MRFFLMSAVLIAGLITGVIRARAADFDAIGLGMGSCGAWTQARHDRQAFGYEQWVVGFLSGIGFKGIQFGDNPLNQTDAYGVWAWVDNYCHANPLNRIAAAGAAFFAAYPR